MRMDGTAGWAPYLLSFAIAMSALLGQLRSMGARREGLNAPSGRAPLVMPFWRQRECISAAEAARCRRRPQLTPSTAIACAATSARSGTSFPALREAGVAEEALRPIARLLLNEILVVERGVQRITGFQLGREVGGLRRLRLVWQEPAPYSNRPAPPPIEIEGDVSM